MIQHTTDDRPEREPSNLFDPENYFTEQELEEFFRDLHDSLNSEEVTRC